MCELLLREGAEVDAEDLGGARAVHEAVVHGHVEQLELLVAHGAEVNCQTRDGEFPLKLAVGRNHVGMVEFLLKKAAADPHLGGSVMLLTAAKVGSEAILALLADCLEGEGVMLDEGLRDEDGRTAMGLLQAREDVTDEMQASLRRLMGACSVECADDEADEWFDARSGFEAGYAGENSVVT
jgi:hypothetical protein